MGQTQSQVKFTPSDGFFLIDAAKAGNASVLELFLRKNPALVYATAGDKSTAWHLAAAEGHVQVLELLVSVTKDAAVSNTFDPLSKVINEQNTVGQTALMLACRGGHYPCAKVLLEHGADCMAYVDGEGLSTLHYAATGGNAGCVLELLKHAGLWGPGGPRPAAPDEQPLHKFVNSTDPYGRTPLHYLAWLGYADGAEALLAAGANMAAKSTYDCYESSFPCNSGTTALHLAAMKGHQNVAIAIIAAFAQASLLRDGLPDPRSITDQYHNTPYSIAMSRKHDDATLLEVLNPATDLEHLSQLYPLYSEDQEPGTPVSHGGGTPATGTFHSQTVNSHRISNGGSEPGPEGQRGGRGSSTHKPGATPLSTPGRSPRVSLTFEGSMVSPNAKLAANPVPDCFLCPLTCRVLQDPVVAADGISYEREAITKHFASGSTSSPITKQKLASTVMYTNSYLAKAVQHWLRTSSEHKALR